MLKSLGVFQNIDILTILPNSPSNLSSLQRFPSKPLQGNEYKFALTNFT